MMMMMMMMLCLAGAGGLHVGDVTGDADALRPLAAVAARRPHPNRLPTRRADARRACDGCCRRRPGNVAHQRLPELARTRGSDDVEGGDGQAARPAIPEDAPSGHGGAPDVWRATRDADTDHRGAACMGEPCAQAAGTSQMGGGYCGGGGAAGGGGGGCFGPGGGACGGSRCASVPRSARQRRAARVSGGASGRRQGGARAQAAMRRVKRRRIGGYCSLAEYAHGRHAVWKGHGASVRSSNLRRAASRWASARSCKCTGRTSRLARRRSSSKPAAMPTCGEHRSSCLLRIVAT